MTQAILIGYLVLTMMSLNSCTQNTKTVLVLTVNKTIVEDSTNEYMNECDTWNLSKNDIKEIINISHYISNEEKHYLYYVMPCEISGEIIVNNISFNFIINAGSTMYLYNADTAYYLGCSSEDCSRFFVLPGGDPDRDLNVSY